MAIFKRYRFFFIALFVLSISAISMFYIVLTPKKSLPIYGPSMINPELADSSIQHVGRTHRVGAFSFINQNGQIINQNTFEGKIYVADFFFTTCGSICPKMTKNMGVLQKVFLNEPRVLLLSHTVIPEIDDVPTLKNYATAKGVVNNKWHLVTGDKRKIYEMARKSYLAVKLGRPDELYDMVHTENFVLIDDKKRVRGFYNGTSQQGIDSLITDIRWLLKDLKD